MIRYGALLLFGKNVNKFFPEIRITILIYDKLSRIRKKIIINGTLIEQLRKGIKFIQKQANNFDEIDEELVGILNSYPEFVLREALVNSVIHRDYNYIKEDIKIKTYEDKIVFISPGTLSYEVDINDIKNTRYSRNPKICTILKNYDFIKEVGGGVNGMFNEMIRNNLEEPEYEETLYDTILTIRS